MNTEQILYTAFFVDNPEKLLAMFPPKHPDIYAHHSTNWYKPTDTKNLEIGGKMTLKIIGEAFDDKGHALLVENPKSKNKYPHITISCAKGVPAVYSNELLEKASANGSLTVFKKPFFIEATEGYADLDEKVVTHIK